ncbi:glycosyltransferase family 2 protein [Candidatus Babeliales bacterium]|nr:glycosyltransferase family 2 protein [Candidatus Babeliales bacterium]
MNSVIICTRNREPDLLRALRSLQKQTHNPTEIIIVDSSDERLIESVQFQAVFHKNNFPSTKLIYQHTTPGLTRQRNVGIKLASGDVLSFFDDDVELEPEYLEAMNRVFATKPEYVGGMGSVTNMSAPASKKYRLFRKIFLLQRDYSHGFFTWSGMPTHAYGTKDFKPVQVLGGCCMSFQRLALQNHLFDESLGAYAYMEDCDISKRVSNDGPLFFNPDARLAHFHSPVARDRVIENRAMYIKNYSYLFFKNFYPQNRFKVLGYVWSLVGLFLEAILFGKKDELKGYWKGLRKRSYE